MSMVLVLGFVNLFILIYNKYQFSINEKNINKIIELIIKTDRTKCIYGCNINNPLSFIVFINDSNYQLCFFLWNNYSNKNELLFEIKYDKVYELYQLAKRINHLSREYKLIY